MADQPPIYKTKIKGDAPEEFDPEGDGYDMKTAKEAGLESKPVDDDDRPHWPSRDPRTGMLLKGRKHKTFDLGVEEDKKLGYRMEKRGSRYYTVKDDE
jgi:hypothetical protein